MIKCGFEYDFDLLQKINRTTQKKYNIINEILIGLILIGTIVMFIVGNMFMGVVLSVTLFFLVISLIFINRGIAKSNNSLLCQRVTIEFNNESMDMIGLIGKKELYKATIEYSAIKKVVRIEDLIYIYLDKKTIIIIPKQAFNTEDDCQKAIDLAGNNYVL